MQYIDNSTEKTVEDAKKKKKNQQFAVNLENEWRLLDLKSQTHWHYFLVLFC